MDVIEKVIISKFRSLGKKEEFHCGDLNIFSGGNDAGKSNILKALNLFFNDRTNQFDRYSFENDFNKWFRDKNVRGERNIEIELHFKNGVYWDPSKNGHQGINENGFIVKKIYGAKGGSSTAFFYKHSNIPLDSLSEKRALAVIQEKVRFIYIPAVRDNDFRKAIQRELTQIVNTGDKKLEEIFNALSEETNNVFKAFKSILSTIDFYTDINFQAILESLNFRTNDQIEIKKNGPGGKNEKQDILISNRGDGIQMQFFAFLLWFIASKDKNHFYIWGFEEPEVAYEYKKQVDIANAFQKQFSKETQIFLTTHSPAFIFIDDVGEINVRKYRVVLEQDFSLKKGSRKISKIRNLEDQIQNLFEERSEKDFLSQDIWGLNVQRIFSSLGKLINDSETMILANQKIQDLEQEVNEKKRLEKDKQKYLEEINRLKPQKIFICEDEGAKTLWQHLFSIYEIIDIDIIPSKGCSNDEVEKYIIGIKKKDNAYNPMVFRQLDLDGFIEEQIIFLEQVKSNKYQKNIDKYKVQFLPVNEIENFALLVDSSINSDQLLKNGYYDTLVDAFNATANNNLSNVRKHFIDKDKTPQNIQNLFNQADSRMRDQAKKDSKKYFNGKEICSKLNINAESKLKSLSKEQLPPELINYLQEIKNHFESNVTNIPTNN